MDINQSRIPLTLIVNGEEIEVNPDFNPPRWYEFYTAIITEIPLRSGTENTITLKRGNKTKGDLVPDKWGDDKIKLHIDGILVTNIDALEKTLPIR